LVAHHCYPNSTDPHKTQAGLERGQQFANKVGLYFLEASAKSNFNIYKIFEELSRLMWCASSKMELTKIVNQANYKLRRKPISSCNSLIRLLKRRIVH